MTEANEVGRVWADEVPEEAVDRIERVDRCMEPPSGAS